MWKMMWGTAVNSDSMIGKIQQFQKLQRLQISYHIFCLLFLNAKTSVQIIQLASHLQPSLMTTNDKCQR